MKVVWQRVNVKMTLKGPNASRAPVKAFAVDMVNARFVWEHHNVNAKLAIGVNSANLKSALDIVKMAALAL